jgi:predicted dehydrogenase
MSPPLRVGLVGCGNVALNDHVPCYLAHRDLFDLVAVADPVPGRRSLAAGLDGLGDGAAFATADELLDAVQVDLLDVCTPQQTHRPVVTQALERRIHVLCEKPLAIVPADAAAMLAAAAASGVRLAVMHNYLFLPEIVAALEAVRSGAIGRVEVVIVNMLGVLDLPGNPDYAPRWRHDPAVAGGGVLVDMLHAVYLAEAFLGAPIERVSGWTHRRDETARVEDIALCRFESSEAAALVNVGWGSGPGGMEISGSDGRISIRYRDGGTGPFDALESVTVTGADGRRAVALPAWAADGVEAVLLDLAGAIADHREPVASAEVGLHVLEAVLAVYASAATGRRVDLPLDRDDALFRNGAAALVEVTL